MAKNEEEHRQDRQNQATEEDSDTVDEEVR